MKISLNWLKDYFQSDFTAEKTAEILTEIGLEVEALEKIESVKGGLAGLKIGLVKEVQKHPNADKLKVTKVDLADGREYEIVCGAPNVAIGQKVIVAPVGTTIFPTHGEPFVIQSKPVRGIYSEGMICSEDEIGLGEEHTGIKVLPDDAPVGKFVNEYLHVETDWVLDVSITPNRGDAMSHIGVARDLVAFSNGSGLKAELKIPPVDSFPNQNRPSPIEVKVENTEACPRFSGLFIENISVKESPDWLKTKLLAVGLRPVNNIVDITNFVMLEVGQPLHAYDASEISGNIIIVKTLPEKTVFKTLDEKDVTLTSTDLMVCNAESGMCIAGVFGGINSGVKNSTATIFLEAAYWNPKWIRRTSMHHQLRTDAATRFEKGTDPNGTIYALKRAALLMKEIAGASINSSIVDVYPNPVQPKEITLAWKELKRLTGIEIDHSAAIKILESLEFQIISEDEFALKVLAPTFKGDVLQPADVVEEILRCYTYSKIILNQNLHSSLPTESLADRLDVIEQRVANSLCGAGFLEMMNSSITDSNYAEKFGDQDELVRLLSYSNKGMDSLRTTLLFPALEVVRYNHNRKNFDLKLFEFGKQYHCHGNAYEESKRLLLIVTGNKEASGWQQKPQEPDIFYLKGLAQMVLLRLGIEHFSFQTKKNTFLKSGVAINLADEQAVILGEINDELTNYFDIKKPVWMVEFDWEFLLKHRKSNIKFVAPSKFPSIRRDLSFFVDENIFYEALEQESFKIAGPLLKEVKLFDVFKDKKEEKVRNSYAISFIFMDEQATLTDKKVDELMQKLMRSFELKFHISVRS